jgi:hypothetical protein
MEPSFAAEVAHAATGIRRNNANEFVKTLLSKYEGKIKDAPVGSKCQECYDVKMGKPSEEYCRLHSEVREEREDLSLKFKY